METKAYSAMLYALADEIEKEDGCTTAHHGTVREAAQRLDEQTVTIRGLQQQLEELLIALEQVINDRCAPRSLRLAKEILAKVKGDIVKPSDILPPERDCCGTFPRTPHRSTCKHYRGKKGGAA